MIAVVGAGPAGLATAYYLHKKGLPYRVLERHSVGHAWRNHYESLRLHTLKQLSHLPDLPYPESTDTFPTREDFLRHQEAYVERFGLNVETGVDVERALFEQGAWRLSTSVGEISADILIAATGIWSNPQYPRFPGQAHFQGEIVHANDYKSADLFRGKRVLVVGVGNTGADVAAELGNAGIETGIVVRSGVNFVDYPSSPRAMELLAWLFRHLPTSVGSPLIDRTRPDFSSIGLPKHPAPATVAYPVVGFKLVDAVKAGRVRVYSTIQTLEANAVLFEDGTRHPFDVLIMATGYKPALDFLRDERGNMSVLALNEKGWPLLDEHLRSTYNPQLYAIGYEYPATSGWIQHTRRVAGQMVEHLSQVV